MLGDQAQRTDALDVARSRRANLHRCLIDVESAIAAPAAGRTAAWISGVFTALLALREAFDDHVTATEGEDGLFSDVIARQPRLAGRVSNLVSAHVAIRAALNAALAIVHELDGEESRAAELREEILGLLGQLARHRQHGADLVYEAYDVDIGGSD